MKFGAGERAVCNDAFYFARWHMKIWKLFPEPFQYDREVGT